MKPEELEVGKYYRCEDVDKVEVIFEFMGYNTELNELHYRIVKVIKGTVDEDDMTNYLIPDERIMNTMVLEPVYNSTLYKVMN